MEDIAEVVDTWIYTQWFVCSTDMCQNDFKYSSVPKQVGTPMTYLKYFIYVVCKLTSLQYKTDVITRRKTQPGKYDYI